MPAFTPAHSHGEPDFYTATGQERFCVEQDKANIARGSGYWYAVNAWQICVLCRGNIYTPRGCFLVVFSRFYPLRGPFSGPDFLELDHKPKRVGKGEGKVGHGVTPF